MTMPSLSAVRGTSSSVSARGAALDLIGAVLRQKHPLDEAIDDHPAMSELPARDRAFARLLVATVLRRLGQIDALIEHCLEKPLPARASATQDLLRLGLAQLLFLRTPPHAAVATSVDLAEARGFLSLQRSRQRGASPLEPGRRGVDREPGRSATQRAALAVAQLERGLWRADDARDRDGASA